MNHDDIKIKLDLEEQRKIVAKSVTIMNGEMPEVFGYLDPSMTTIPELISALQQQIAIGERFYIKLLKAQNELQAELAKGVYIKATSTIK